MKNIMMMMMMMIIMMMMMIIIIIIIIIIIGLITMITEGKSLEFLSLTTDRSAHHISAEREREK